MYACQYQPSHLFCDITKLLEHEQECEYRKSQKTRFDPTDPEIAKSRMPIQVYCKYDVSHVFSTIEECEAHMENCPKRDEFEAKAL